MGWDGGVGRLLGGRGKGFSGRCSRAQDATVAGNCKEADSILYSKGLLTRSSQEWGAGLLRGSERLRHQWFWLPRDRCPRCSQSLMFLCPRHSPTGTWVSARGTAPRTQHVHSEGQAPGEVEPVSSPGVRPCLAAGSLSTQPWTVSGVSGPLPGLPVRYDAGGGFRPWPRSSESKCPCRTHVNGALSEGILCTCLVSTFRAETPK